MRGILGFLKNKVSVVISSIIDLFLVMAIAHILTHMSEILILDLAKRHRQRYFNVSISVFARFLTFYMVIGFDF